MPLPSALAIRFILSVIMKNVSSLYRSAETTIFPETFQSFVFVSFPLSSSLSTLPSASRRLDRSIV
jgi:hypothetical protein